MAPDSASVEFVDLVTGTDFEVPAEAPAPGFESSAQSIMGPDCFAKQYLYPEEHGGRSYLCEVCGSRTATRLLAYAEALEDQGDGTPPRPPTVNASSGWT